MAGTDQWAQARAGRAGWPTARTPPARVCEGCRVRPATIIWPYPPAGDPFQLCQACYPFCQACYPALERRAHPCRRPVRLGEAIAAVLTGWAR